MGRYPIVLSSMEEDFRKIGLLPELSETDDPTKPRDVPSPDPDTLGGLDDSEGEKSAHMAGAKQPKPKMGPDADDAENSGYDPDEDGGGSGAQKGPKGSYSKVAGGKEASVESMQYSTAGKQPMSGKGKKQGDKTVVARGLKPAKKVAGMMKEGRFTKAATLIEEVSGLLRSVQIDEEIDQLLHSFRLVAENAALLSDRLTEISDEFQVEAIVSQMEDLSRDAVEVIDIIENELEDVGGPSEDEDEAVAHSSDVQEGKEGSDRDPDQPYDVPSPAFAVKEQSERVLNVMVTKLMDALEGYDNALVEMGMGEMGEGGDDGDDDKEVHLHTKAKRVHVHHGHDDDDADADDDSHGGHEMSAHGGEEDDGSGEEDDGGGEEDGYGGEEDGSEDHGDHDTGDDGEGESDHDTHSLMAKMKALKARREAMSGGRSFRGSEE